MSRFINLIPLAGAGQRFLDAGYSVPKPLIDVGSPGVKMIVRAANALPKADNLIFICRKEHIEDYQINNVLESTFPGCEIVSVDSLTEGQACTCLLADSLLDDNDCLTIGACDNDMLYDYEKYHELTQSKHVDAFVWTFRNNPAVLQDPCMYGWVDVDAKNMVNRLSVKIPLSENPMTDHAVIGAFTFNRASVFRHCVTEMIKQNRRIRNEFYLDEAMNVAIELGYNVSILEVDSYMCWGTPQDLETYEYWRRYFETSNTQK